METLRPGRPGFVPRPVRVGFLVEKVALGQGFLSLRLPTVSLPFHDHQCSVCITSTLHLNTLWGDNKPVARIPYPQPSVTLRYWADCCAVRDKYWFVTYVSRTCFDLYKVIIREVL